MAALRVLVILPSWVGDGVMATPALRLLRRSLPGALIGGLARPGIDELLAGLDVLDEVHVEIARGVMGPKRAAAKVRPRRYDAAVLLTNSFSSALVARLAGIPERIGYDRDGRGILLTRKLTPLRRADVEPFKRSATNPRDWAPVPACEYYWRLVSEALRVFGAGPKDAVASMGSTGTMGPMELSTTPEQDRAAAEILDKAGLAPDPRSHRRPVFAVLNPGGNNPAKRWPADRFAAVGGHLWRAHGMRPVVAGSPGEAELARSIASLCPVESGAVALPALGLTLASLKGVVRAAAIMVTNDTGPRHIAAAFGVPVVSLFGPTDPRWTTIPFDRERVIVADPKLDPAEVADDHPDRCAIDRIAVDRVVAAADALLFAP